MGKNKVLVKVHPEGKYVVDLDKNINMADVRLWQSWGTYIIVHQNLSALRSSAVNVAAC